MPDSKRDARSREEGGAEWRRCSVGSGMSGRANIRALRARIPQRSPLLIARKGLLEKLDNAVNGSAVTLIQAPPGYGKTSILSQWAAAHTDEVVAWLSATPADDDPALLLSNLTEALSHAGVQTQGVAPGPTPSRHRLGAHALANVVLAQSGRVILCIDDIHQINERQAIDCLATLIESTGPSFRIILTSRQAPALLMGRLRAYGDLTELGPDDLRFGQKEIIEFFSRNGPLDLSAEEVSVIEERTEGWAVGLRLTSMVLGEPAASRTELLSSLTGDRRQLVAFFSEEIFARQPARLQDFLLRTSILDRFCADLCTAVTGERDAQELIEQCESKGLFVMALDQCRTWYRYHYLFSQFLQRKLADLHRGEAAKLHRAASDWLFSAGLPLEATEHSLLAGDACRAGEILESQCDRLFSSDEQPAVVRLAGLLPAETRNRLPKVLLMVAWRLISTWRLQDAEDVLRICRERVSALRINGPTDESTVELLESYIAHRELNIAIFRDDLVKAEGLAEGLLSRTPPLLPYLKVSIYHDLLDAQRGQLNLSGIDRIATLTHNLSEEAVSDLSNIFDAARLGSAYMSAGRLDDAKRTLTKGMAAAHHLSRRSDDLASVPAMPLAAVLYERNEVGAARELIERYLTPATHLGLVDQLICGWITRARILWHEGTRERAIQVLKDARVFGSSRDLERLKGAVESEMVRLLLAGGQVTQAMAVCPELAALSPAQLAERHRHATLRGAAEAEAWVRLAIAHGRTQAALEVIRRWRRTLAPTHAMPLSVQWELLYARALFVDGNQQEALRTVDRAMNLAEVGRLQRTFLDEGGVLGTLLEKLAESRLDVGSGTGKYAIGLLAEVRKASTHTAQPPTHSGDTTGLLGSLSRRELEVLRIAAMRVSNREIGEALGLTEGSVKWYLQRVYDKFGVRRRSDAARKARMFGLIA